MTNPTPQPHAAPDLPEAGDPAALLPPSADLLGVSLALTDYERAMEWMDAVVARREKAYVCVAAVHTVMASREDPELREAVRGSSITVPDGQPLVWALRALGHPIERRVYGPDLMAKYCERSARTGVRMYLYGGRNQGALAQLALNLRQRYPGLRVVGGHCPPFRPLEPAEEEAIAAEIDSSGADVVWVGIGVPKQEKWMARMRDRLDAPVLIGVGAAFDFHADTVRQAPRWLQDAGLEWLFRLATDPRRLWRRYLRYNPRFVLAFARQYARARHRRR